MNESAALGVHILLDYTGFLPTVEKDGAWMLEILRQSVRDAGVREVHSHVEEFDGEVSPLGFAAVVLIDEAQMLQSRDLMEEFRGLLNLEVAERKLISFVFFGLRDLESALQLDPPLAQRVAIRYRLRSFDLQTRICEESSKCSGILSDSRLIFFFKSIHFMGRH
jgi:S-adenosylmethionine/arginine decarboxylase-like enzyme